MGWRDVCSADGEMPITDHTTCILWRCHPQGLELFFSLLPAKSNHKFARTTKSLLRQGGAGVSCNIQRSVCTCAHKRINVIYIYIYIYIYDISLYQ